MVEEGIYVKIDGTADGFEKASQDSVKAIEILTKQLERLQRIAALPNLTFKQYERLGQIMASTQNQITKFKKAQDLAEQSQNKFASTSNSATLALTNLGRVASDAPYGFIGIANNLNPLLEGFQRLKTEAKAAGVTLGGTLLNSLTGAGGIGLALSAVTAAVSFATVGFGAWTRGMGGSANAIDKNSIALAAFRKEIDDAKQSIDDMISSVDFANRLGAINVGIAFGKTPKANLVDLREQNVASMQLLSNLEKERKKAAERLKTANKNLIDNLAFSGDPELLSAFDKNVLSTFADKLTAEQKELHNTQVDAFNALKEADKKIFEENNKQRILGQQIEQAKIDVREDANKKTEEANKKAEEIEKKRLAAIKKYNDDMASLNLSFARLAQERAKIGDTPFIPEVPALTDTNAVNPFVRGFQDSIKAALDPSLIKLDVEDKIVKPFQELGKAAGNGFGSTLSTFFSNQVGKKMRDALKAGVSTETVKGIGAGMVNQFESLTAALTIINGAFESFFNTILEGGQNAFAALGNAITHMLKKLVASIAAMAAVAGIISVLLPGSGGFLKVFQGLLGAKFGIPGHAQGGIVPPGFPNDTYLARLSSGERIIPANQSVQGTGVMFPEYLPVHRIGFDEIVLGYEKAKFKQRRFR